MDNEKIASELLKVAGSLTSATIADTALTAKWFPQKYESWDEWQEEWQYRVDTGEENASMKTVSRGFTFHCEVYEAETLYKIAAGKLSSKEVLDLHYSSGNKAFGIWWYMNGNCNECSGIEDSQLFAEPQEGPEAFLRHPEKIQGYIDEGWPFDFEMGVVLVAKRPKEWHSDDNKPEGIMGQSYIDKKRWPKLSLVSLQYWTGSKWVTKRASGAVRL
tara:strand:+ start:219 stop:869 length:651 start_codon:yes stop_codon:yes gene_type:complete